MEHDDVGGMWEVNADAWTILSRRGYDVYRDHVNTPAFLVVPSRGIMERTVIHSWQTLFVLSPDWLASD